MIQSTIVRAPIFLTLAGVPVTGLLPINFLNSSIEVIKADGTHVTISLVASGINQNLFEIDSTQSPGLYHILLPASATGIVGPIQYSVYPAASLFNPQVQFSEVSANETNIGSIYQYLFGNMKIDPNLDRLTIYQADGITPLISYYLLNSDSQPTIFDIRQKLKVV